MLGRFGCLGGLRFRLRLAAGEDHGRFSCRTALSSVFPGEMQWDRDSTTFGESVRSCRSFVSVREGDGQRSCLTRKSRFDVSVRCLSRVDVSCTFSANGGDSRTLPSSAMAKQKAGLVGCQIWNCCKILSQRRLPQHEMIRSNSLIFTHQGHI